MSVRQLKKICLAGCSVVFFFVFCLLVSLSVRAAGIGEPYGIGDTLPILDVQLNEGYSLSFLHGNKDNKCKATVKLIIPEGYVSEYGLAEGFYEENMEIKGRGNSTWGFPKKPYQIKFPKGTKPNLFGMGESRTWVLLANYADRTMIRNKLTYAVAEQMGMPYTCKSVYVELILNGQYNGTYQLIEKVEVGDNRVEVGDTGYLIEKDTASKLANDDLHFATARGTLYGVKGPEEDSEGNEFVVDIKNNINTFVTSAEGKYIIQYMDEFEEAAESGDFRNSLGKRYDEYITLDSLVDYFLAVELCKNVDALVSSTYIFKAPGEPAVFGPLWDFDLALGNAGTRYGSKPRPTGWILQQNNSAYFNNLMTDRVFMERVMERFAEIKPIFENTYKSVDGKEAMISQLSDLVADSRNYEKWDLNANAGSTSQPLNQPSKGSVEAELKALSDYCEARVQWMSENLPILYENSLRSLEGSGSREDPYRISSEEDFLLFTNKMLGGAAYENRYFKQTADLDMSQYPAYNGAGKSAVFKGVYDGGGHTININIKGTDQSVFPYTNGTIMNLIVTGRINNTSYAGGIARSLRAQGRILNCICLADVKGVSPGGITSSAEANGNTVIANCYYNGTLEAVSTSSFDPILPVVRSGLILDNNYHATAYSTTHAAKTDTLDAMAGLMNQNLETLLNYQPDMRSSDFRHWLVENGILKFSGAVYLKNTRIDNSAQLNIETTLVNETGEAMEDGYLIFAVYQKGVMTDAKVFHQTFAPGSNAQFRGEGLQSGDTVKVMLWDSGMQPVDFLEYNI